MNPQFFGRRWRFVAQRQLIWYRETEKERKIWKEDDNPPQVFSGFDPLWRIRLWAAVGAAAAADVEAVEPLGWGAAAWEGFRANRRHNNTVRGWDDLFITAGFIEKNKKHGTGY